MVLAVVFVGVVAPVVVVLIFLALVGAWQGMRGGSEQDRERRGIRERMQADAHLLRRQSFLRRQRDLRLGRLTSDPRDDPRDPAESVRVLGGSDQHNDRSPGIDET